MSGLGGDITQGLPRVEELLDAKGQGRNTAALLAPLAGVVELQEQGGQQNHLDLRRVASGPNYGSRQLRPPGRGRR